MLVGLQAVGVPPDDPMIVAGRQLAALLANSRAAAGANRPTATTTRRLRGTGNADRLANRLGRAGPDRRRPARSRAVARGVRYLLDTQKADGTWDEAEFTGTGFPRVFYLRYHYYRDLLPADGPVAVRRREARGRTSWQIGTEQRVDSGQRLHGCEHPRRSASTICT